MLHIYWEIFKQLCVIFPQHGVSDQLFIQYFYEGLLSMERKIIDDVSRGAILNKTPTQAKDLINVSTANIHQFGPHQDIVSRCVNKVSISTLEDKISNLNILVERLASCSIQQVEACGIYTNIDLPTDMCPTLQDESTKSAKVIGGPFGQRKYNPYLNTYNLGWKDHPNLSYRLRNNQQGVYAQPSSSLNPPLEDVVYKITYNVKKFLQEMR
ncbi:hypothetical protein GQ457_07G010180 [Hibiscus cannabinus]